MFNFPEYREISIKIWYFFLKWTGHGVLKATKAFSTELTGILSLPTDFLLAIVCALRELALRFHGAHTAMTGCWRLLFALHSEAYTNIFLICMFVFQTVETIPAKRGRKLKKAGKEKSQCKLHRHPKHSYSDLCAGPQSSSSLVWDLTMLLSEHQATVFV